MTRRIPSSLETRQLTKAEAKRLGKKYSARWQVRTYTKRVTSKNIFPRYQVLKKRYGETPAEKAARHEPSKFNPPGRIPRPKTRTYITKPYHAKVYTNLTLPQVKRIALRQKPHALVQLQYLVNREKIESGPNKGQSGLQWEGRKKAWAEEIPEIADRVNFALGDLIEEWGVIVDVRS